MGTGPATHHATEWSIYIRLTSGPLVLSSVKAGCVYQRKAQANPIPLPPPPPPRPRGDIHTWMQIILVTSTEPRKGFTGYFQALSLGT